jgi:signal transduction histidine kinase
MKIEFIVVWGTLSFLILSLLFLYVIFVFRKKIAQSQNDFYNSLIQCELAERKRISQEIHDGIGGLLGMAKFHLSNLECNVKLTPVQRKDINKSIDLIDFANDEARNISNTLLPASINRFGLTGAIEELIKIYIHQFQIEFYIDCNIEIANTLQANLYRIVNELLNNSRKHSNCSKVEMEIVAGTDKLFLHYSDNGSGFEFNQMKRTLTGNGLRNIENRVTLLNGKFNFKIQNGSVYDFEFQL